MKTANEILQEKRQGSEEDLDEAMVSSMEIRAIEGLEKLSKEALSDLEGYVKEVARFGGMPHPSSTKPSSQSIRKMTQELSKALRAAAAVLKKVPQDLPKVERGY